MTALNSSLREAIEARAIRRNLTINPVKVRYANDDLVALIPPQNRNKVLIIGVGHGHDILSALLDGHFQSVVGVDPYIESDGNGSEDYEELRRLIESFSLGDRFTLERTTAQEYLGNRSTRFDTILAIDVLHHIFVTPEPLSKSDVGREASEFFASIKRSLAPTGTFLIKDVEKDGFRPLLHRMGILKGNVDYSTKQNWNEWTRVAEAGGLQLRRRCVYVPYRLRNLKPLLDNRLGLKTLCRAYYLAFSPATTS